MSLLSNVFLCRDYKDSRIWKPSLSREFSTRAFHLALEGNHTSRSFSSLVWMGLVPLRVEVFCWLVIATKVSMTDNLRRRVLTTSSISNICVMCHKKEETVNCLSLHCEVAAGIWGHFFSKCGVAWCSSENIIDAIESCARGPFARCGRTLWRLIPFDILWCIWKERNDRI